jgi:high-affinity nickel permease
MFGLDDKIAGFSDGTTLLIVLVVAILLGLRHASDPDHLTAVTTLLASGRERTKGAAARLGLSWGLGHATSLFLFGLPIVIFKAFLPESVQRGTETIVGFVIVALAVWLLVRWRSGVFHLHVHGHEERVHAHGHDHGANRGHPHLAAIRARSPLQAYCIGLLHGIGGSGGVGVLLLTSIHDRTVAVIALALFSVFTAVSMALLSVGFASTLSSGPVRRSFHRLVPVLGVASFAFGLWYALGALDVAPYYF